MKAIILLIGILSSLGSSETPESFLQKQSYLGSSETASEQTQLGSSETASTQTYLGSSTTALDECTATQGQADYRGTQDTTEKGTKCVNWDTQTANLKNRPAARPNAGLEKNYCRNPDGEPRIWCYTEGTHGYWEFCEPKPGIYGNEIVVGAGSDYRGMQDRTARGFKCQKWTEQSPHEHDRTPEKFPNSGLGGHNYCRNPDGEPRPWCYTIDPNERWGLCDAIPEERLTGNGIDYRGKQDVTKSGDKCITWQSNDMKNTVNLPCRGLGANYCRNPDNESTIWCYTDVRGYWDFCEPKPQVAKEVKRSLDDEQMKGNGSNYRGYQDRTAEGTLCRSWDSETAKKYPEAGLGSHGYCRNPDGSDTIWCYTGENQTRQTCKPLNKFTGCPSGWTNDIGKSMPDMRLEARCKKARLLPKVKGCQDCNTTEKEKQNEKECTAAGGTFKTGYSADKADQKEVYDKCEWS